MPSRLAASRPWGHCLGVSRCGSLHLDRLPEVLPSMSRNQLNLRMECKLGLPRTCGGQEEPASWLFKDTSVSSSSKLVEIGWVCPFGHTTHSLGGVRRSSPAKWLPLLPFHSLVAVTINWQFDGEMGRRRDDSAKLASVSAEQEEGARPNRSITAPVRQKPSHIGLQQRKRRKHASSDGTGLVTDLNSRFSHGRT